MSPLNEDGQRSVNNRYSPLSPTTLLQTLGWTAELPDWADGVVELV